MHARRDKRLVRNMTEERRRWFQSRNPESVEKLEEKDEGYFSELEEVADAETCRIYF